VEKKIVIKKDKKDTVAIDAAPKDCSGQYVCVNSNLFSMRGFYRRVVVGRMLCARAVVLA
jgi:hypothetical protein